ncbi:hypothetical protein [Winogradskyella sp. UBA3174]|uniref:hypothetical protein n=1 Tax=Winogradskyella sp. UBA3174 TaxID=1947785 RepID=UPI0025D07B8F|nr:hypothetical protein [Winogradskyella sp. UBA3174]|tara:strand:- start:2598 stop:3020 length:423 start_codon:yes stop_codon:yes gene_type:complete
MKESQHREFVQAVITRMGVNSFQIKSLTVTFVAAFLGIYASNSKVLFIITPVPIVLLFWFLDAYYLQLERKFRGIYNDICDITAQAEKKTTKVFLMNPTLYKGGSFSYWNVFKSITIFPLYFFIIICLLGLYFYLRCSCN